MALVRATGLSYRVGRFRLNLTILIALAAALTGCGDNPTRKAGDVATTALESDRLSETVRSSDAIGVILTPPNQADNAAVSAQEARASLVRVFGNGAPDSPPKLAILNTTGYVNRLVWAFIGYHECAPLSESLAGGPGPEGQGRDAKDLPTTLVPVTCIGVTTVDANTGEYLMGYSAAKDAYEAEQRGIREIQQDRSGSGNP